MCCVLTDINLIMVEEFDDGALLEPQGDGDRHSDPRTGNGGSRLHRRASGGDEV